MKCKDMFVGRNRCVAIVVLPLILFCVLGWVDNGISEDSIGTHLCLHKKPCKNHMATRLSDTIPFARVEVPPIFEQCKAVVQDCEQRNCVDKEIDNRLKRYVDRVLKNNSDFLNGVVRVSALFVIDTNGDVTQLEVNGKNEKVNKLVYNLLSKRVSFIPGEQDGVNVNVGYSRNFFIQRGKIYNDEPGDFVQITENVGQGDLGFIREETLPVHFLLCDEKSTKKSIVIKECIQNQITKFVSKNFDKRRMRKLGLSGLNKIYVRFTVSKCGNLKDVQARAPHPVLEKEAERVVNILSSYVLGPATYNPKPINLMFSLPIVYGR